MILIKGNHAKGTAQFSEPGEAWDFMMEKRLDGASATMAEKTQILLGIRVLCDPRIIRVKWEYKK